MAWLMPSETHIPWDPPPHSGMETGFSYQHGSPCQHIQPPSAPERLLVPCPRPGASPGICTDSDLAVVGRAVRLIANTQWVPSCWSEGHARSSKARTACPVPRGQTLDPPSTYLNLL